MLLHYYMHSDGRLQFKSSCSYVIMFLWYHILQIYYQQVVYKIDSTHLWLKIRFLYIWSISISYCYSQHNKDLLSLFWELCFCQNAFHGFFSLPITIHLDFRCVAPLRLSSVIFSQFGTLFYCTRPQHISSTCKALVQESWWYHGSK